MRMGKLDPLGKLTEVIGTPQFLGFLGSRRGDFRFSKHIFGTEMIKGKDISMPF